MKKIQQYLRLKIKNHTTLAFIIWSMVITSIAPSYSKMLSQEQNATEQIIAEQAKAAATIITDNRSDKSFQEAFQQHAITTANNMMTKALTQWLPQYGNIKANLNIDRDLSLKNSEFSWLMPWYDSQHTVLYTQHSIHHSDLRLQTNHGFGIRQFQDEAMFGLNAFYDYDLSQYHSRLGLGAEYWQDYLKLSANHYFPLSSWRAAKELNNDYNAKPARGWDLHAEGWLAIYPNIGATLKYEQYYGREVALFGKDQRQNNPFATTVGINWTPFPLITLSTEHKIGNSGLSNTQANISFTWQFNKNYAQHLEPSEVNEMSKLSRTRYDFVQRNNNIVLQYQKRNLISLVLKQLIKGFEGASFSIIQRIDSKYPLDKVSWQAPELISAGGSVDYANANLVVKLPAYKIAATPQETQQKNHYRLTATAYDNQGNASPQVETFIDVIEPMTIHSKPADVVQEGSALANGKDINKLRVILRDNVGNILPNTPVTFTLPTGLQLAKISSLFYNSTVSSRSLSQQYDTVTNNKGEASVQFTAQIAGQYNIKVVPENGIPVIRHVTLKPSAHQVHIAALTIIDNHAIADGLSTNKIKVHITDAQNHPIAGTIVDFIATNATIAANATTNIHGDIEITLTSDKVGNSEITAISNGESRKIVVNFAASEVNKVKLNIDQTEFNVGDNAAIILTLLDQYNNAVVGLDHRSIQLHDSKNTIDNSQLLWVMQKKGVYTTSVPMTKTGLNTLTATVNNQHSSPIDISILPSQNNSDITQVTLTSSALSVKENEQVKLILIAKDKYGNGVMRVSDADITLTDNTSSKPVILSPHWQDDQTNYYDNRLFGVYTSHVILQGAGKHRLTLNINGITTEQEIQVTSSIKNIALEVIKDYATADGIDTNQVRARVTDEQGHPVQGAKINVTSAANIQTPLLPTDPNGYTEINLSYTTAMRSILQVTLDGENRIRWADVHFVAGPPSQIIELDKTVNKNNLRVQVLDTTGNFIPGLEKKLKIFADGKLVNLGSYSFISKGKEIYVIPYIGLPVRPHQIEVKVDGTSIKQKFDLNVLEK